MRRCVSTVIAIFGIFASQVIYADTTDNPIITGLVSPFKVCLQPQQQTATSEAWSVAQDYVTQVQAETLQHQLPVCFDQTLSVTDFNNLTAFEKDVFTAAAIWQSYLKITSPIEIDFYGDNGQPRFGGEYISGNQIPHMIPMSGGVQQQFIETQPEALSTATSSTPSNTAVPVMQVFINEEFGYKNYCFDSAPTVEGPSQCAINKSQWDLTSVLQHELGHGYGIGSVRSVDTNNSYGNFPIAYNIVWIGSFDFHTNNVFQDGKDTYNFAQPYQDYYANNQHYLLFTGSNTQQYLASMHYYPPANPMGNQEPQGIPLANFPLTDDNSSQNFSHFGIDDQSPVSTNVVNDDLMGLWYNWDASQGQRLEISTLDLKVLEDMGYPLMSDTQRSNPRDIFASTGTS